ncbi:hypothetical protein T439DRAFT_360689 [Meredithblackwellia eburnea MCA 4105]
MLKRLSFNSKDDVSYLIPPAHQPPSSPSSPSRTSPLPSPTHLQLQQLQGSYFPPIPSISRPTLHKTLTALTALLVAWDELRDLAASTARAEKRFARALRELGSGFGQASVSASASVSDGGRGEVVEKSLAATASLFDALGEVDLKYSKLMQKEYEGTNELVGKFFKKIAKEEKALDELLSSLDSKVQKATLSYEKSRPKPPSSSSASSVSNHPTSTANSLAAASSHDKYMTHLSSLSSAISLAKKDHGESTGEKRERCVRGVGVSVARLAEASWKLCRTEGMRRAGERVGEVVARSVWCESGMPGEGREEHEVGTGGDGGGPCVVRDEGEGDRENAQAQAQAQDEATDYFAQSQQGTMKGPRPLPSQPVPSQNQPQPQPQYDFADGLPPNTYLVQLPTHHHPHPQMQQMPIPMNYGFGYPSPQFPLQPQQPQQGFHSVPANGAGNGEGRSQQSTATSLSSSPLGVIYAPVPVPISRGSNSTPNLNSNSSPGLSTSSPPPPSKTHQELPQRSPQSMGHVAHSQHSQSHSLGTSLSSSVTASNSAVSTGTNGTGGSSGGDGGGGIVPPKGFIMDDDGLEVVSSPTFERSTTVGVGAGTGWADDARDSFRTAAGGNGERRPERERQRQESTASERNFVARMRERYAEEKERELREGGGERGLNQRPPSRSNSRVSTLAQRYSSVPTVPTSSSTTTTSLPPRPTHRHSYSAQPLTGGQVDELGRTIPAAGGSVSFSSNSQPFCSSSQSKSQSQPQTYTRQSLKTPRSPPPQLSSASTSRPPPPPPLSSSPVPLSSSAKHSAVCACEECTVRNYGSKKLDESSLDRTGGVDGLEEWRRGSATEGREKGTTKILSMPAIFGGKR